MIDINLKKLRLEKGYKQSYISFCTGIPQSTLSRFESGRLSPTLHELKLILECMGLQLFVNINTEN
jgi:transcriptional regulator with XRE-family HTH domain